MIKAYVLDNFGWKVFSLLLSVALWFIFVGESEVGASAQLMIQYKNLPKDLELSSEPVDRLYVNVRGPASRLKAPVLAQGAVLLDMASVTKPGEQTFTLDDSNVMLPAGVTLVRAVPSQIRLQFDNRAYKDVPVHVRFAGPPPQGYRIAEQVCMPDKLKIAGPETRVNGATQLETDAIDLSSTVGSAEFRVAAFVADPHLRIESPTGVVVRVNLEKTPAGKQ
jgi:hypothetical protein